MLLFVCANLVNVNICPQCFCVQYTPWPGVHEYLRSCCRGTKWVVSLEPLYSTHFAHAWHWLGQLVFPHWCSWKPIAFARFFSMNCTVPPSECTRTLQLVTHLPAFYPSRVIFRCLLYRACRCGLSPGFSITLSAMDGAYAHSGFSPVGGGGELPPQNGWKCRPIIVFSSAPGLWSPQQLSSSIV